MQSFLKNKHFIQNRSTAIYFLFQNNFPFLSLNFTTLCPLFMDGVLEPLRGGSLLFTTSWKQKTSFLKFSGVTKMKNWCELMTVNIFRKQSISFFGKKHQINHISFDLSTFLLAWKFMKFNLVYATFERKNSRVDKANFVQDSL